MVKGYFDKAKEMKDQAAKDFKAKDYDGASEKYYSVLNIIRQNEQLKKATAGKELETQSRLNIALCRLNQSQFDQAIDQCERVLDNEPGNWKACFRLANAQYQQAGNKSSKQIVNYAKKAMQGNPAEKKIKEFYDEVQSKYETPKEKGGLKKVIVDDPEEKKSTTPPPKREEPPQEEERKTPAATPSFNDAQMNQGMRNMENMTDEQLGSMINQMKSNKEYARTVLN